MEMRIRPPKVFATIVSAQGIGKGEVGGRSGGTRREEESRCRLIVRPGRRWAVRITGSTSGEEVGALPYIRPGRRTAGVFYRAAAPLGRR
jgi:hypothetical protein